MSSAKFEHILVECFKPFEREDAKSRREIPINGIRKIYSLTTRVNNTTPTAPDIKAKPLTCTSCEANKECDLCKLIPPVDQKGVDFDDIQQVVPMFVDDQDIGLTDDEDQEDALVDENIAGQDEVYTGSVVWGKYGRHFYPEKIVDIDAVPSKYKNKLPSTEYKYVIYWYGETSYSVIAKEKVELLGRNRVDKARSQMSKQIEQRYHLALADIISSED